MPEGKRVAYTELVIRLIRERLKGTTKKVLEKLVGCLQHASPVVYPGKAKLRNLEHALHLEASDYNTKIILSDAAIIELKWWLRALQYMNGVPLTWIFSNPSCYYEVVWTDAALRGELKEGGMGGCTVSGHAYQIDNRATIAYAVSLVRTQVDISLMELIAVFIMFAYFAPQWEYKNVKFYCDNDTVVSSLAKSVAVGET